MTVLVVASPCAVVIAIPSAILSAIAAAAKEGVLFKGGAHLERAGSVRAIAFDKTGTLTTGKPQVVSLIPTSGKSETDLLGLAASVESFSEHPIARAIVIAATAKQIEVQPGDNFQAIIGRGAAVNLGSGRGLVGKYELFQDQGLTADDAFLEDVEISRAKGNTTVIVGTEKEIWGAIALGDTLRPSAEETIKELREAGVEKMVMLTGDSKAVAANVAGKLGIDFAAELMPADKVERVKELREKYGSVAMVGDGINDAPALATATIGVSLGSAGTAVALEAADIVLMSDNLAHLPYAIRLGRKSLQVIKQNLIFAFGVMALLLISTFFASLRLPFAVAGHEGSTVLVILNGLRLLRFRSTTRP